MIYWHDEGAEVRQGLNLWRPSDKNIVGGKLRLGRHMVYVRWSKTARKMFYGMKSLPRLPGREYAI